MDTEPDASTISNNQNGNKLEPSTTAEKSEIPSTENDTLNDDFIEIKNNNNFISETWKVKGFPSFYKTGHVKNLMIELGPNIIDVHNTEKRN